MTTLEAQFLACRKRLHGLAYRMLGSTVDAEDILQDAYLRLIGAAQNDGGEAIRNVEAFLVTTVARLCLDQMKSARAQREVYVGPWLPEPVLDEEPRSPEAVLTLADDLSFALMMTLEKLSAPERAAFLLHDVFDTPFADIARTLGKSEAACRQLAARARKAVTSARPARPAAAGAHAALLAYFTEAVASGDAGALEALLARDAIAWSDGGGVKASALNPIIGAEKIARFFTGIAGQQRAANTQIAARLAVINGAPGLLIYLDGVLDQTLSLDVVDDRIAAVFVVRNPDKLKGVLAGSPQLGAAAPA